MRIAYACYASAFTPDGVNAKISAQLACWRRAGHEAELFCLSPAPQASARAPALDGHLFTFAGLKPRLDATVALARAVHRFTPDVLYLRYDIFVPPVWALVLARRLVVEINTDDRGEALSAHALGHLYHELTRALTLRRADGFACVTHELASSPRLTRFARPAVVIANGVEPTGLDPVAPTGTVRPAAAMLIGYRSAWSGVDKAIDLARAIPDLDLHLIGADLLDEGQALPANVIVHGSLSRAAYRDVLGRVDFGIGPLALHRKGMSEASPLKVREYLMAGLPVLAAYRDTDFLDEEPWFLHRLANTEDNIEAELPTIEAWIAAVRGRRVPRAAVIERLAMEGKELARLAFFEQLIAQPDAARPRFRRRAPSAEVPALKPRAYYRAVSVYGRIRIRRTSSGAAPAEQPGVRILGYHRVADDGDVLAVTREDFRRQMEVVLSCGARVVALDAAVELLEHPLDRLHVCITFDDGYLDTLESAAPILAELGLPATVFLPTAIIDGEMSYYWYRGRVPPALDWDGVAELVSDGSIDVQSHSHTHPRLPALEDQRAFDELARSKGEIERQVGRPVSSFCYPAGLYGARDAQLVLAAGYRSAVTCRPGLNQAGADLTQLHRTLVSWSDDLGRFEAKLAGQLDRPSRLTEALQRRRALAR